LRFKKSTGCQKTLCFLICRDSSMNLWLFSNPVYRGLLERVGSMHMNAASFKQNKRGMTRQAAGFFSAGLAAVVLAIAPMGATAQTPALTFTTAPTSSGAFVIGWQFTTNVAVTVSSLGNFDNNNDGLVESHTVGIYNSVGTLLVSAIVPAGTAGTLISGFRYTSISPFVLASGQSYTIAATNVNEIWSYGLGATGVVVNPAINVPANSGVFNANGGATLAFPTTKPNQPTGYQFITGPDFLIGAATVPEPGSVALLVGTGTTGALFLLRRRKK
jgi:hypothetical protein